MEEQMAEPPRGYAADDQAAADLANALMELPENWLMCRDMRHSWEIFDDFRVTVMRRNQAQELRRTLACQRCSTLRTETYRVGGFGIDKVRQHYTYPEHYQLKGVPRGSKPQAIVQQEQFRRAMTKVAGKA